LFQKGLAGVPGLRLLSGPEGTAPNYWFYALMVDAQQFGMDRERLMGRLAQAKIQSRPIWYLNHHQRPYRHHQAYKIERAVQFWKEVLNLPCSTNLEERQVNHIVKTIVKLARSK
jgi:dTDP-4-amino-4,6-dideoxygalactose transaminase